MVAVHDAAPANVAAVMAPEAAPVAACAVDVVDPSTRSSVAIVVLPAQAPRATVPRPAPSRPSARRRSIFESVMRPMLPAGHGRNLAGGCAPAVNASPEASQGPHSNLPGGWPTLAS